MTDDSTREQQVEALALAAVQYRRGVTGRVNDTDREVATALLDGPVAAMLAEARREGAVEALREAAEELYGDDGPGHPLSSASWLRSRAAQIERGEQ